MHKKLPHISLEDYYQFITFRTHDSYDNYAKNILEKNISNKRKEYELDVYLDNSNSGAYFFGETIDIIKKVIYEKNHILYEIEIFSIMPNHIHLLLKQKSELFKIVQYIKGKSSLTLNKYLNKKGRFWHENYYDKLVRDEKHFAKVYQYIENNPVKAELNDNRVFYG